MENLESYKDVRTIASVSALFGVAAMAIYFQNENSKIKADLQEVQKHLATIIPAIDPNTKQQLDQVVKAVRVLDSRIAATQNDLKTFARIPYEDKGRSSRKYVRFTESRGKSSSSKKNASIAATSHLDKDFDSSDLEDDIAAMMD